MFESLSERLNQTFKNITGRGRLTDDNIKEVLRDVRQALLEADVALPVVKRFINDIKDKALGQTVSQSLNPGQEFIKIVNDELVFILGSEQAELNFNTKPPAVILMAGLQGSGKTTTTAKLARLLKNEQNKKVMVVSCDIYRPAAIEQLKTLAEQVEVSYHPSSSDQKPVDIVQSALQAARSELADVLLVDTAGRLHVDEDMMGEIKELHASCSPIETLFVVDSMTGQDAANTAKAFHDALPLTGIVLTKTDGDARGGAALSMRMITEQPIKFIGVGEKVDALQAFHPDRMASRILGMGDVLSLIEEAEQKIDRKKAEKAAKKIQKGSFDLEDFRDQIQQMKTMGGMAGLVDKLPGMGNMKQAIQEKAGDKQMSRFEAIINSMTPQERRFPQIIKGSRKRRIAQGSGTELPDVNKLLKQFTQMQKMMKKMSKGGMKKMMRQMQNMLPPGQMPPF